MRANVEAFAWIMHSLAAIGLVALAVLYGLRGLHAEAMLAMIAFGVYPRNRG